jgi:hypothetical protein
LRGRRWKKETKGDPGPRYLFRAGEEIDSPGTRYFFQSGTAQSQATANRFSLVWGRPLGPLSRVAYAGSCGAAVERSTGSFRRRGLQPPRPLHQPRAVASHQEGSEHAVSSTGPISSRRAVSRLSRLALEGASADWRWTERRNVQWHDPIAGVEQWTLDNSSMLPTRRVDTGNR